MLYFPSPIAVTSFTSFPFSFVEVNKTTKSPKAITKTTFPLTLANFFFFYFLVSVTNKGFKTSLINPFTYNYAQLIMTNIVKKYKIFKYLNSCF